MSGQSAESQLRVSIVIPSYNSAVWLPSTLKSLVNALSKTSWIAEIIVVDDGSTDETTATLSGLESSLVPYSLRIVTQDNQGRFFARWEGIQAARHELVLIMDSRLLVDVNSLLHLDAAFKAGATDRVWNGHVATDPSAPLVGRFWEVPTYTFWGSYLKRPRVTMITLENFDHVPKGTGFLFLEKELFARACLEAWPVENAHLTSDDTKLLRFIAAQTPIRLDPDFSAIYRPRTTVKQFLAHSWSRGTLFVDSYAGTSRVRNLVLVALSILPPVLLALLATTIAMSAWPAVWGLLGGGVLGLLVPLLIAARRGCPIRAQLSYLTFVLPFGVTFWAGLTRGLFVHRRSFRNSTRHIETAQ
ncbi:glycosyltransferase family 2 protein [Cryobacterium flavum]|uniref:Glycosyltransferase family 2 protein n=1 Tax=Cryobacterium flavum TaxID=1424659 RepID=A0ABY2I819_9MICO|nr:glycosyltransferase family 2 protein [Cryobacterium flavum]